jgi:acyl-CoA reductase-like NAD-dependent aldehyde dehydrogenase
MEHPLIVRAEAVPLDPAIMAATAAAADNNKRKCLREQRLLIAIA